MEDVKVFDIVESLAGHDKGRLYVVLQTDGQYLSLVDGRIRTLQNPKRKKRRHVAAVCTDRSVLTDMAANSEIKKVLLQARGKFDRGGK